MTSPFSKAAAIGAIAGAVIAALLLAFGGGDGCMGDPRLAFALLGYLIIPSSGGSDLSAAFVGLAVFPVTGATLGLIFAWIYVFVRHRSA